MAGGIRAISAEKNCNTESERISEGRKNVMRFCQQQKTRELFHYCTTAYKANPQIGYAKNGGRTSTASPSVIIILVYN